MNQNYQVRPPFQENLIDENYPKQPEDHTHMFGLENNEVPCTENSKVYQLGYQNAMMDFQRWINLINKNFMANLPKKVAANHISTNQSNKKLTQ